MRIILTHISNIEEALKRVSNDAIIFVYFEKNLEYFKKIFELQKKGFLVRNVIIVTPKVWFVKEGKVLGDGEYFFLVFLTKKEKYDMDVTKLGVPPKKDSVKRALRAVSGEYAAEYEINYIGKANTISKYRLNLRKLFLEGIIKYKDGILYVPSDLFEPITRNLRVLSNATPKLVDEVSNEYDGPVKEFLKDIAKRGGLIVTDGTRKKEFKLKGGKNPGDVWYIEKFEDIIRILELLGTDVIVIGGREK